jgi:hypothetical protein
MSIPDRVDVLSALEDAAAGLQLGHGKDCDRVCWVAACVWVLSGEPMAYGRGLTMREACADAWLATWGLSELIDTALGHREPRLPDGRWRLEACPPGRWERVHERAPVLGSAIRLSGPFQHQ